MRQPPQRHSDVELDSNHPQDADGLVQLSEPPPAGGTCGVAAEEEAIGAGPGVGAVTAISGSESSSMGAPIPWAAKGFIIPANEGCQAAA